MDINEIRLKNYRELLLRFRRMEEEQGLVGERGLLRRFGEFTRVSPRFLSHVNNGRKNIGDDTARAFEAAFKLPHGWVDHDHVTGPMLGGRGEKEFIELALMLYRQSPIDAQAALMRFMADRLSLDKQPAKRAK